METAIDPLIQAFSRLEKLDDQLDKGVITQNELNVQRLHVLVDLLRFGK